MYELRSNSFRTAFIYPLLLVAQTSAITCRQSIICWINSCLKWGWACDCWIQVHVVHLRFLCTQNTADLKEQRICVALCFNLGMLQKHSECWKHVLKSKQWEENKFVWFSKFESGVTSVEGAECLERPLTNKTEENLNWVKEYVYKNRRITIYEAANVLWISFGSVQSFLKGNLTMPQIAVKFMPCLLSEKQKEKHVTTYQNLQERLARGPEYLS